MKDCSQYKLNIKPSPRDERDFKVSNFLTEYSYPETLDLRVNMFDVRDQGSQGSCAAMSGASMKEWQEIIDVDITHYLSPQFIYYNRANFPEEGMYMRDLMDILLKKGVCSESAHPYGKFTRPSDFAYTEAFNYIINSYARVYSIEELKQSLFTYGPAVIAVPVYNYTPRMWYQRAGDSFLGGHAMTIVGYNTEGFIIRNSWGVDWADRGYTIFPYSDWGLQYEIWTSVDAKSSDDPIEPGDVTPDHSFIKKYWWLILIIMTILIYLFLK